MANPFAAINVEYYASSSKSNQAKHASTAALIQKYIDDLQIRLALPRLKYSDITEIGGSPSTNDKDVTKWWFVFWEGQPDFWFNLKKSNGANYAPESLKRYMPTIKNQLKKKFLMSRYLKVIEETFASAMATVKTKVKASKSAPPKNKVYTNENITFILQRCLWFNSAKYIDFFIFQTATLRLCSRATETSRLTIQNLSSRELCEGAPNKILQCYLVRDKSGVDNNHPLIPNKFDVFGDMIVAVGLALFLRDDNILMPSIAGLAGDSAVSAHYTNTLSAIWKRYPPAENVTVRQGTSHFGKHTAQWLLDGAKLHIAAQLFGGWNIKPNIGEGARSEYFSNPFPYLLDGAKCLAGWNKVGSDYQRVSIPTHDVTSKDLGDKICSAFFGHLPEASLNTQMKQLILVCLLSKWDQLVEQIRSEPNGLFRDPSNHIIFSTLVKRLNQANIELTDFNNFKSDCMESFNQANTITTPHTTSVVHHPPVPSPPPPVVSSESNKDYTLSLFQHELENIQPLKALLDLATRNTDPGVVLVNFFAHNFIDSYRSSHQVDNKTRCRYRKIKAAVRVMTRFLDTFPTSKPTLEEAHLALDRIKSALLSEATHVKTQSKRPFNEASPLHLSIIRSNEMLLTDKTKTYYRPLPKNTPHSFIEHMYAHKIYII